MNAALTMHDLPLAERPRERLVSQGAQSLSATEELAIILGNGVRGEPVTKLAERLLASFGSMQGIARASLADLQSINGIGRAKACQIQACAEVARRMQQSTINVLPQAKITSPEIVHTVINGVITDPHKEHYVLVSLDARSKLLGVDVVSMGILDAALVHPRETFATAIRRHAAKVILGHNHPSGDVEPSDDDLIITKRLITAGKILGITVIDHVIVSESSFYSLQAKGRMFN
jgi:DNA repair protein RadC